MKLFLAIFILFNLSFSSRDVEKRVVTSSKIDVESSTAFIKQIYKVKKAIEGNKNFNNEIVFLIDMSIISGKYRFFIYDLKLDKVIDKGIVAHGVGSETNKQGELFFSNTIGSHATSLGMYCIGKCYYGRFGKSYKLYGLDNSNSNAIDRNIVLHYYDKVPYKEQKNSICNSFGCPMVSEMYFSRLEKIIDNSDKQILLYIFY